MLGCLSWMYRIMAVSFIAIGVAAIVWAVQTDSPARWGVGIGLGLFVPVGIVFLFVGRFVRRLDRSKILADGIAGTAQVLSIRDTGVTIANLNAVFAMRSMVTIPTMPPYEAEVRATVPRQNWGTIQPGAVIPVMVDPGDHSKVVFDPRRPVQVQATSPALAAMAPQGGAQHVAQFQAADVISRGTATTGVLQTVVPTGMTAGQFAPDLAAHEADDPMVQVSFTYVGPGGAGSRTEALVRVPDGKAGTLATGAAIPVRYLPDRPEVAAIDWDRL